MLTACASRVVRRFPGLLPLLKRAFPPPAEGRCINIGGGRWYHPRWENLDWFVDGAFVDRRIDLRLMQRIELPDNCASAVFTSHVLEHLTDEQGDFLLREACRLLHPGGVLRVAVPDAELAIAAYRTGDAGFFDAGGVTCRGSSLEEKLVNFFASYRRGDERGGPRVEPQEVRKALAELDRAGFVRWCVARIPVDADSVSHVNGYDYGKLEAALVAAGFAEVARSAFRGSRVPAMRGRDFDNRPRASLYVEAVKRG
jgi:hypothetical protein